MPSNNAPLQIWKGPKTYVRWDRKTGWIWKCRICKTESEPHEHYQVAQLYAFQHLDEKHRGPKAVLSNWISLFQQFLEAKGEKEISEVNEWIGEGLAYKIGVEMTDAVENGSYFLEESGNGQRRCDPQGSTQHEDRRAIFGSEQSRSQS